MYPNIKPVPDSLRISDPVHTPELSEVREPAYAADAVRDSDTAKDARTSETVHTDASRLPDTEKTKEATPKQDISSVSNMSIPDLSGIPQRIHAANASERVFAAMKRLCEKSPHIHCLTNAVTMNNVANILLAIGGSAIMAQDCAEAAQITALCQATLLNTGMPSDEKFAACCLAGEKANELGHPVVLDPVGVGASTYRMENIRNLLFKVHPNLIRCNLEEALTLLALVENTGLETEEGDLKNNHTHQVQVPESSDTDINTDLKNDPVFPKPAINTAFCEIRHGGVESGMNADADTCAEIAVQLANACRTAVLISGSTDAVSDGTRTALVTGGDARAKRITGSGCMLSAICAALLAAGENAYDAALTASILWKQAAECAGQKTDANSAGMGSFHMYLFDAATNLGCIRI